MKKNNEYLNDVFSIKHPNKTKNFGLLPESKKLDINTNFLAVFGKLNKTNPLSTKMYIKTYFIDYDFLDINPDLLFSRGEKLLHFKNIIIIIVYKNPKIEFKMEEKTRNGYNFIINVIHISFPELVKEGLFKKIYFDPALSSKSLRTFWNFRGLTYSEVQVLFKIYNIDITGSSAKKRHILDPLSHRLSQLIMLFESSNINGVIQSFHKPPIFSSTNNSSLFKAIVGPDKKFEISQSIGNLSTKAVWDRIYKISDEYLKLKITPNIKSDTRKIIPLNKTRIIISKSQNSTKELNLNKNDSLNNNKEKVENLDEDPWVEDSLNLEKSLKDAKIQLEINIKKLQDSYSRRKELENLNNKEYTKDWNEISNKLNKEKNIKNDSINKLFEQKLLSELKILLNFVNTKMIIFNKNNDYLKKGLLVKLNNYLINLLRLEIKLKLWEKLAKTDYQKKLVNQIKICLSPIKKIIKNLLIIIKHFKQNKQNKILNFNTYILSIIKLITLNNNLNISIYNFIVKREPSFGINYKFNFNSIISNKTKKISGIIKDNNRTPYPYLSKEDLVNIDKGNSEYFWKDDFN